MTRASPRLGLDGVTHLRGPLAVHNSACCFLAGFTADSQPLKMKGPNAAGIHSGLPIDAQLHILSFLPPNEVALSGRLVSPDLRDALSAPQHCTVVLSQTLPLHAVPWAQEAGQEHVRQLPFKHKMQLLCTAAASGSEAKGEMVLTLLQSSVFPEMLLSWHAYSGPDPGVAAVTAGHTQLLPWLLHRCPGLVNPGRALEAAARHCDLAGLQAAWRALQNGLCDSSDSSSSNSSSSSSGRCGSPVLSQGVLDAAAGSATPDAVAKVEWLLAASTDGSCSLQASTAEAAARSGYLARLQWLKLHGCRFAWRGAVVVLAALRHADLEVAQWLVDEAGCELPRPETERYWGPFYAAAAQGNDSEAKLRWLQERRAPPLTGDLLRVTIAAAIGAGRQELVQQLLRLPQMGGSTGREVLQRALDTEVSSSSLPVVQLLHHQAGVVLTHTAYMAAARAGSVAFVRLLACEAGVPIKGLRLGEFVASWPRDTLTHSRGLLEAVQLVLDQVGLRGWQAKHVVCKAAARGELPLVQLLLRKRPGYRPDWEDVAAAVEGGCAGVLECLAARRGKGCGLPRQRRRPHYLTAARAGDRAMLEVLRRLGEPWDVEVVRAVREGCGVAVLKWMVEQGAPMGSGEEMRQAVGRRLRQLEGGLAVAPGGGHGDGELAWLRSVGGRTWCGWGRRWACLWLEVVCLWAVAVVCGLALVVGHLLNLLRWMLRPVLRA